MIKVKNGKAVLKGMTFELVKEYRTTTKAMIEMLKGNDFTKEQTKDILTKIVENAFLTEEEIKEKFEQDLNEFCKNIAETLFKNLSKEEKEGADNE
jgi:DNA-binding ferritin-like protein (Dps family)